MELSSSFPHFLEEKLGTWKGKRLPFIVDVPQLFARTSSTRDSLAVFPVTALHFSSHRNLGPEKE